jgi:hypothetical protein
MLGLRSDGAYTGNHKLSAADGPLSDRWRDRAAGREDVIGAAPRSDRIDKRLGGGRGVAGIETRRCAVVAVLHWQRTTACGHVYSVTWR